MDVTVNDCSFAIDFQVDRAARKTHCLITRGGAIRGYGLATCSVKDAFSKPAGRKLALSRALEAAFDKSLRHFRKQVWEQYLKTPVVQPKDVPASYYDKRTFDFSKALPMPSPKAKLGVLMSPADVKKCLGIDDERLMILVARGDLRASRKAGVMMFDLHEVLAMKRPTPRRGRQ